MNGYKTLEYIRCHLQTLDKKNYFDIGYYPNSNTLIETKLATWGNSPNGWQCAFGCRTNGTADLSFYENWGNTDWAYFVGGYSNDYAIPLPTPKDKPVEIQCCVSALTIDETTILTNKSTLTTQHSLCLFANPNVDSMFTGDIYYFRIYENDVMVHEFLPVERISDGKLGYYDTVEETFIVDYNSNYSDVFTAGPYASTIIVDSDVNAVPASGGTINVTVNSDTPWSATSTGSWYTMSQTAGTENDTAITITVPSTTAATQSEDTITFTNENGDTDQLTIKQRKYSAGGIRLIDLGADEVETFYIGNEQVEVIYMGEEVVYQAGEFIGLKMKSDVTIQMGSGSTYNLKINSSEPWTLSVDTAVTWLEFSQLTGGTGETIVTITTTEENQTGSDRSTTITATTANYSATCVVKQISVHYVEFIHRTTISSDVNNAYIDTLITPTTATTFRVVGMGKGYGQGNTIVGYQDNDSKDYRLFWHGSGGGNLCFDFNNERLQNSSWGGASNGRLIDITCNNYSVTSGDSQTPMMTGTTQSSIQDPHTIKIDVGTWWFKSLQIWEGQTLVFDGQAAVDDANNIIGIYDNVSNGWFYNSNLSMAYEIDNLPISWSSSENTTQADYEVDSHLYQDFHFCTLQLEETIGTSICHYYYRVYITTDHKVEVKQSNGSTDLLHLSLGYGESGELRTDVARNCFISHNSSGNGTFANVTFECNDYQLNGMDYHWDFYYQA